ncbi:MAG TPA: type IV toxin-antitoxin system AbiEi family antitoxin domain-containing protein [Aridibacter sp.]|nr:type IV toxin-antitoxin system AbiEi family antitoxin domain-containing protein [Aridibacter sp.]
MEEGRRFLENQIETARSVLEEREAKLHQAQDAFIKAREDLVAYMAALTAYTRESDDPYRVSENDLPTALRNVPALFPKPVTQDETISVQEGTSLAGHPVQDTIGNLDVSGETKVGTVRRAFLEKLNPLSLDEILDTIPATSEHDISREDLHRIIGRMLKRGEIERVGRGTYRYILKEEAE